MKIAVLNYGDVKNYGDVLFPRIVLMEMGRRIPDADFTFITPTGKSDAIESEIFSDAVLQDDYDAMLIAGGEVVHRYDELLRQIYHRFGMECIEKPTDVVFRIAESKAPVRAWIGLGVPPTNTDTQASLERCMRGLTHVSVRGPLSKRQLETFRSDITVIPDIGWLIPDLARHERWNSGILSGMNGSRYLIVHVIPDFTDSISPSSFAEALRHISLEFGLEVVLLPITDCWGGGDFLEAVKAASGGKFTIVPPETSYEERGRLIMAAEAFVGQSMHGLITAVACGKPAVLIYPDNDVHKFSEILMQNSGTFTRLYGWAGMPDAFRAAMNGNRAAAMLCSQKNVLHLQTYFDLLCDVLKTNVLDRPRQAATV